MFSVIAMARINTCFICSHNPRMTQPSQDAVNSSTRLSVVLAFWSHCTRRGGGPKLCFLPSPGGSGWELLSEALQGGWGWMS